MVKFIGHSPNYASVLKNPGNPVNKNGQRLQCQHNLSNAYSGLKVTEK
jgi:hypothetical protein